MEEIKYANTNFIVILEALLEAAGDSENVVREAVCKALQKLSKERTSEVVEKICSYKEKKGKISTNHCMVLLNVLESVAQDSQNKLPEQVVSQLIGFSVDEMLKSENTQVIQSLLSNILIYLGTNHCNEVLAVLIPKLQPGCDPNPNILMTLGHLSCANVKECVPIIKIAFNIMIPMMPTARNEQLRISLAFVIGKFCEALDEYMSISEVERDSAVTPQTFSEEIVSAYNVIANSWVQAKEVKVTESAICCLGPLFSLLPEEKAGLATSRAITCLLNAYRRPCIQHHLITSCLATVLSRAPPSSIIPVLDQVLHSLGNMVVIPPDYALPQTVKQHSEVLRCYDHVGKHFTERLTDLLLKQMKLGSEKEKIESLIVTAHLISGSEKILESRIQEIISAMANLLLDPSVKVKKALVKAIVALFCKRTMDEGPYNVRSSSEAFIEFLVRHSVMSLTSTIPDCVELSNICTATIHLLSSTVDNLRPCLWNTLLNLLTNPAFDTAVPIVTKALAQIAPKTSPEEVASKEENSPSLETVLCRSFAFLGSPLNNNRGVSILQFLQQFARYLSPHISDLWAHKLPQLIKYLQESEWNESEWDSLLLEVINSTVTTISCHDSNWPVEMSRRLTSLLATTQPGDEENVLLCSLAITTAVIEDKQHVAEDLETVLLRFKSGSNIKVCARAIGILSSAHLEMVLTRLEQIAQTELNRRNSRLLGLMKDLKAEAEIEKCREILLECYAAIAQRCPFMELYPKLETLTAWILTQITVAKEGSCRNASLEAIYNCGESLVRNKSNAAGKHKLKNRSNILNVILQLIQQNKPDPLSVKVITVFAKLPPPLIDTCRTHILKICFDRVLCQDPPNNGYDHATAVQTLKQLGELVEEMLIEDIGPDRLDEVTTLLEPWVRHRNSQQRLSGITVLRTALLAYYHNMKLGYQNPSTFNQSGDLIGTLVVRFFDSNEVIGKLAAHSAGIVLAISNVYEGHSHDPSIEKIFENLPEENAANHVAKILCSRLPHAQIHKLTARLLDGLTDCDQTACSNASDVLACVFTIKGADLFHYVNDILGSLLLQLFTTGNHPSNGVSAVIALAKHHPKLVMNILLKQALPLHSSLAECWKLIASDQQLSLFALEHILHIIQSNELYQEDNKISNRPKIAALQPLAAVYALSEMVDSDLISDLLRGNLAQLLPSLMTTLAAFMGVTPPVLVSNKTVVITNRDAYKIVPAKVVKECLQRLLLAVGCDSGAKALSSAAQLTHIDALVAIVPQLTVSICQTFPLLLPTLMVALNQYSTTNYEPQRIIITAFYAECLAVQCSTGGDLSLVDSLVSSLESAATAPDHNVRAIALRGLRYIAELPPSEREKHLNSILASLLEGLEDSTHSRVSLESMLSLSSLIPALNEDALARIQLPLALRLKPFFEKEEIGLRSGSMRLFGQLYCKNRHGQDGYKEHLEGSLVCLLLHLSEPEPSVVKACKFSLREAGPALNAKKVAAMFQDHLIDDGNLQYEHFATVLVKSIVEELDHLVLKMFSTCLTYMKSNWPAIRGNAALLAGLLYLNMNGGLRCEISLEPVSTKLLLLANDSSPEVRARAIQAMALLFSA